MLLERLRIVEVGEGDSPVFGRLHFCEQVSALEIAEVQRAMAVADAADALCVAGTILVVDGQRVAVAVGDSREVQDGALRVFLLGKPVFDLRLRGDDHIRSVELAVVVDTHRLRNKFTIL